MTLRCDSCGEEVRSEDVYDGGHVVETLMEDVEAGHAMDDSCYRGECANCPVPVPVQRLGQELCGPVVEVAQ